MSLGHGILGFLSCGAMTGYDLAKTFSSSVNFFWSARTSQIYLELGKLEEKGMVSCEEIQQKERPNKKLFSITEKGREELRKWLADGKEKPGAFEDYRSSFLMRVFFSAEAPESDTEEMLEHFAARCGEMFVQLSAIRAGLTDEADLFAEMTADFGARYMEMSRAWAEDCLKKLRNKKEESV